MVFPDRIAPDQIDTRVVDSRNDSTCLGDSGRSTIAESRLNPERNGETAEHGLSALAALVGVDLLKP
ncbi:hypothetical protein GCM10022243_64180 [Saccharothrix violaceirubra]